MARSESDALAIQDAQEWLFEFFCERNHLSREQLRADTHRDIFDAGLLDSFGLIELITTVEQVFKFELSAADLEDERFRTIDGLAHIVAERYQRAAREGAGVPPSGGDG